MVAKCRQDKKSIEIPLQNSQTFDYFSFFMSSLCHFIFTYTVFINYREAFFAFKKRNLDNLLQMVCDATNDVI